MPDPVITKFVDVKLFQTLAAFPVTIIRPVPKLMVLAFALDVTNANVVRLDEFSVTVP